MRDAEAVMEIGLSLPIGVFNLTVTNAGRRTRIYGRPARGFWRARVMTARSVLGALGYIADGVINALWPAEAVARASSRDFNRAVRVVDQPTEPEEQQKVWKSVRRANR